MKATLIFISLCLVNINFIQAIFQQNNAANVIKQIGFKNFAGIENTQLNIVGHANGFYTFKGAEFKLLPCEIHLPNINSRTKETLFVTNAKNLDVGFIEKDGDLTWITYLKSGQSTPRGLIHYQQNMDCENAYFYTQNVSEDPGMVKDDFGYAPSYYLTEEQRIEMAKGLPELAKKNLKECLIRCGLSKNGKFVHKSYNEEY